MPQPQRTMQGVLPLSPPTAPKGIGKGRGWIGPPPSAASFPANTPPGVDQFNAAAAARQLSQPTAHSGLYGPEASGGTVPLLPMPQVPDGVLPGPPRPQVVSLPSDSYRFPATAGCPFVNARDATEADLRAQGGPDRGEKSKRAEENL